MAVYRKTEWVNGNPPPINDKNLNHAEEGTESASTDIRNIGLGSTVIAEAEVCGTADFVAHATETVVGGVKMHTVTDTITGEITGFIDSGTIADEPTAVIDFNASDNLPGVIRLSFTQHIDTMWYDLYIGDALVAPDVVDGYDYLTDEGTWDFHLVSNNAFGSTVGVIDSGTAKFLPTEPPAEIIDFTASDNEVLAIQLNWTDNGDATKFDLYSGVTIVAQRVSPGDTVTVVEGTETYHVRATNHLGSTDSNEDDGTATSLSPSAIIDFQATDAVVGDTVASIVMTFTNVSQPATYDLYRDNVLIRTGINSGYSLTTTGGTWMFKVKAVNPLGEEFSNEDSGTAISALYPPEKPHSFTASDDGRRSISIDFIESLDAEQYDLYKSGILIETEVYPGYSFPSDVGTWNFFVRAVNGKGYTDSDVNSGTSLPAFSNVPDPVNDLVVSTDLVSTIHITFTELDETVRFDLYRNGLPYHDNVHSDMSFPSFAGEWQFHIVSTNPIGTTAGLPVTGSAAPSTNVPTFPVDDFTAADGTNVITMTWSPAEGASRYDLYIDDIDKVEEDVMSPYPYTTVAGTWNFNVRAVNLVGHTSSRSDSGTAIDAPTAPSKITNLDVSDNLTEAVYVTFSAATGAVDYTLYRSNSPFAFYVESGDTVVCDPGTYEFFVTANNDVGDTPSDPTSGTSVAELAPPTYISDFEASTTELDKVIMTFTASVGATNHALYKAAERLEENITTGFEYLITDTTPADYYVRAENVDNYTDSNHWTGYPVSVLPGSVTIEYAGGIGNVTYTFTGTGDGTIVPDTEYYGRFTFNPPSSSAEILVNVCMCGGGGSGAKSAVDANAGGGHAGASNTFSASVSSPNSYVGNLGTGGMYNGTAADGEPGGETNFLAEVAAGGLGGDEMGANYLGDGAAYESPCGGTFYDGTKNSGGDTGYSGYGGQASVFADGGDGDYECSGGPEYPMAYRGAGGSGSAGCWTGMDNYSGIGGAGSIKISWG